MPAPFLSHDFETGQIDTTVISTANSGVASAGTAFSALTGSPTYSTTHQERGPLAMRVDTTATYTETNVQWTGLGSILTSVWFRAYLYITANPVTTITRLISARTSAAANSGFLTITTTGVLQAMNAAQVGQVAGTVAVTQNQWVRIEFRIVSSTTVGELEWWLYNTPDAPIASFDDHVNSAATMVNGANTDGCRFGAVTATGPANFLFWMDDLAVSSRGQIGPSPPPSLPQRPPEFIYIRNDK